MGMQYLEKAFQNAGIETIPSAANFITLNFDSSDKATTFTQNMLNKGIILRHLPGWGLPNCVRVTVGTEEENEYLISNL